MFSTTSFESIKSLVTYRFGPQKHNFVLLKHNLYYIFTGKPPHGSRNQISCGLLGGPRGILGGEIGGSWRVLGSPGGARIVLCCLVLCCIVLPACQPVNLLICQPAKLPTSQPANRQLCQPSNPPTRQPANQLKNQTANQPTGQPANQKFGFYCREAVYQYSYVCIVFVFVVLCSTVQLYKMMIRRQNKSI